MAPLRLPYFPEAAEAALAGLKHLILVESRAPISFFGYRVQPSGLRPHTAFPGSELSHSLVNTTQ
jgi:hypothetical protein